MPRGQAGGSARRRRSAVAIDVTAPVRRLRPSSQMADFVDLSLDRQPIERFEPQAGEELDAVFEREIGSRKALRLSASAPSTAAGSGTPQWAVTGLPGQTGQTSLAAWSQTVKTKSICGAPGLANSSQLLLRSPLVSADEPFRAARAPAGCTAPLGKLPAL